MADIYQIKEYDAFIADKKMAGYITLPEAVFNQLESFILTQQTQTAHALDIMAVSAKKGIGRIITAKNYVGVIRLKDGTAIEILPKIASSQRDSSPTEKTKKLLLQMLKTQRDFPYKTLQPALLSVEKMDLLDIFIRMFIDEVILLTKRGLQGGYETIEANETFCKGKIQLTKQVQYNQIHQERFYVAYDAFTSNCPENKLLKSTLHVVYGQSRCAKNRSDLKMLLHLFREIDASVDILGDFAKSQGVRQRQDYQTVLLWCRIFLLGNSFTPFTGKEAAWALLFPMERLFESYLAAELKKRLDIRQFELRVQDTSQHLFDWPAPAYRLKPDMVITRKSDHAVFILDTKWKRLEASKAHYGLNQADMYQMYAYQKKYGAENVTLIYPQTEELPLEEPLTFSAEDGAKVQVVTVNLLKLQPDLDELIGGLTC